MLTRKGEICGLNSATTRYRYKPDAIKRGAFRLKSKTEQLAEMQQRRDKILEMIREDGTVTVKALTKTFGLTEATLRTDLRMLQKQGFVQRYHGGATLMTGKQNTGLLQLERQTHMEEKDAIGRLAAQHIENGDTVIFDSGTTTTAIADAISHIRRLSVVTTAVNIALKLGGEPGINVLLTGGTFYFRRFQRPETRPPASLKTCCQKNCFSPPPVSRHGSA